MCDTGTERWMVFVDEDKAFVFIENKNLRCEKTMRKNIEKAHQHKKLAEYLKHNIVFENTYYIYFIFIIIIYLFYYIIILFIIIIIIYKQLTCLCNLVHQAHQVQPGQQTPPSQQKPSPQGQPRVPAH